MGSLQRKPPSPRASTEIVSLQKNKSMNREGSSLLIPIKLLIALERGLLRRRPVKELVNQGILLNRILLFL